MWDLPRAGLEPVSPALAGRLSTTAPQGKPYTLPFKLYPWLFVATYRWIKPMLSFHRKLGNKFLLLCWCYVLNISNQERCQEELREKWHLYLTMKDHCELYQNENCTPEKPVCQYGRNPFSKSVDLVSRDFILPPSCPIQNTKRLCWSQPHFSQAPHWVFLKLGWTAADTYLENFLTQSISLERTWHMVTLLIDFSLETSKLKKLPGIVIDIWSGKMLSENNI